MSSNTAEQPELDVIERAWSAFTDAEPVYREVTDDVVDIVTDICSSEINAGNYDGAASLADVLDEFLEEHCTDDSDFTKDVLESDAVIVDTLELGREQVARAIFQRLIEELVDSGQLLYVYNRQQVRSHVAEMARYFALIRQRLQRDTEYQFTPNLVKMVKLASADREQPITGKEKEESARFRKPIRKINERIKEETTDPAWELADSIGGGWRGAVHETMETMSAFFDDGLPDEFDSLAAYQARAFEQLYLDAVTEGTDLNSKSHVVTASTGGGKTEAFMFPTLAYCLTATKANIRGNKAILTYPRRDLCNNQFERAFEYITELNRIEGSLDVSFEDAPLTISLQHSSRDEITLDCPHDDCDGTLTVPEGYRNTHFVCDRSDRHEIRYASVDRTASADVIVTTQNSLHRRLMDDYGRQAFWEAPYPPKFMVLDEVHIYTDQAGMNVANVVRRFKQGIRRRAQQQSPTLVASSATINNAEEFTRRIFDTDEAERINPTEDEKDTLSREHFIFVKATDPRDVMVPVGDSVYKPREEWTEMEPTTATNLSCMIQIAFAFFHTMRKERAGSRPDLDVDKDRVLGFVDSIDSVSRLGGYVQEAEDEGLFELRYPDAILGERGNNPDCPRDLFRGAADDQYGEDAVCESLPPNPNVNPCPVYEDGECWWTMQDRDMDLEKMTVAIHKSGRTQLAGSDQSAGDDWDQLISTSALEVGFDHSSIIGTFQYRAPRNVPGFLQRKGRGGRDARDEPITVVVLGSTPTDSYYFHHSNYLSDPRDEHLEIPLDEENTFIRAEHMTAAIVDYFNVVDRVDADRIFTGGAGRTGPDIDYLERQFDTHREEISEWLTSAFSADDSEVERVLNEFEEYVIKLGKGITTDREETPYWEFFSRVASQENPGPAYNEIEHLISNLQEEQ